MKLAAPKAVRASPPPPGATPSSRRSASRRSRRASASTACAGTYASLRCACGDDVAYASAQLGHEDPRFTLKVYAQATTRRERLSGPHLRAYDQALEWARMGTIAPDEPVAIPTEATKSPSSGAFLERMMGLEPTTFCMASRRSSQLSYIREAANYSRGLRQSNRGLRSRAGRPARCARGGRRCS
jgi:hypothetical protein